MAWIETVPEEEAGGPLAALYRRVVDPGSGRVDEILRVHSLHPPGLAAHFELYRTVMRGTPGLPAADREMIALITSRANGCHY